MLQWLIPERRLPVWLRRSHPIVAVYLRKPLATHTAQIVLGSTAGVLLLFGGFGLPMLYFLLWLALLMQQAAGTANKIREARVQQRWDLLCAAPFTSRELLLSLWGGSFWQLQQSQLMPLYRLLQGLAVIGVMIFGLLFAPLALQQWLLVLVVGTLVIAMQPLVEMYFGGMTGLLAAVWLRGHTASLALAACLVLLYWMACIAAVLLLLFSNIQILSLEQVLAALCLPTLLPLALGYAAQRAALRLAA